MWGRLETCGGLAIRQLRRLPTGAQIDNLPHKIVAARKETRGK
jgi:hypothetical protein